jgi:hypothetical protein
MLLVFVRCCLKEGVLGFPSWAVGGDFMEMKMGLRRPDAVK